MSNTFLVRANHDHEHSLPCRDKGGWRDNPLNAARDLCRRPRPPGNPARLLRRIFSRGRPRACWGKRAAKRQEWFSLRYPSDRWRPFPGSNGVREAGILQHPNERELELARRKIGMLFQDGASYLTRLVSPTTTWPFPRGNAGENGMGRLFTTMAHDALAMVNMAGHDKKMPANLSGGMRKRGPGSRYRLAASGHPLRRADRRPRPDRFGQHQPPHSALAEAAGGHFHCRYARHGQLLSYRPTGGPSLNEGSAIFL